MKEIWKPVIGYEGLYEVSSMGRLKRKHRISAQGRVLEEKIMKTPIGVQGYKIVGLRDGTSKSFRLHSLIAQAFLGPKPSGYVIDHLNGVRHDNRVSNLEYVTPRENICRGKGVDGNPNVPYRGVALTKQGTYKATITIDKKERVLGTYKNLADAISARKTVEDDHSKLSEVRSRAVKYGKGYYFSTTTGDWRAQSQTDGKRISLGLFKTEEEAAKAVEDHRNANK